MKTDIKIFMVIALFILVYGCDDDFLHRPPLDQISSESYWTKANDLKLNVNQFYTMFGDGGSWGGGCFGLIIIVIIWYRME